MNIPYRGRPAPFPSQTPLQQISHATDYIFSPAVGSDCIRKPMGGQMHHQRSPSESFLREEQPSWLEELLEEPETPVQRGHRRSSSESFAYLGAAAKPSSFDKPKFNAWESSLNFVTHSSDLLSTRVGIPHQTPGSSFGAQGPDRISSKAIEKQEQLESGLHNQEFSSGRSDRIKPSVSRTDPNCSEQQYAQRSRVRKLHYIAELERNVQVLQAEGSEVSAELEFLDRQNLILGMENRAMKQRLDSLSQEQLIKYYEHDMLQREIERLQTLYHQQQLQQQQLQQQQQQPKQHSNRRRSKRRDLDSQFANLSVKDKETSSSTNAVGGSLKI